MIVDVEGEELWLNYTNDCGCLQVKGPDHNRNNGNWKINNGDKRGRKTKTSF